MHHLQGARDRLAKLPDEDRRSQAAALALRFAALLGGSDDEDEGEGGGDQLLAGA
ncbi:hypothetical protein MNEG_16733 [Monoraphidium neglectum]|uniref:Uncharacterized protein n=1 Tax=Monoraphidium neglectum TaxID=145388 RepID=A0A0D2LMG7_9CHLO|nr:hypothetical protein MNEG_16733 [Monoraphidium neglectum]KIY91231.1 hypothetical protein MNEG_16733 [Monoraphidium neglectum]|eukprot:XP_013890251.1 hypothetical protein MNEG_16733 [Monoraphidium neglectum]